MSHFFLTSPTQQIRSHMIPSGRSHEWNGPGDRVMIIWNDTKLSSDVGWIHTFMSLNLVCCQTYKGTNPGLGRRQAGECDEHSVAVWEQVTLSTLCVRPIISRPEDSPSNPCPARTITSSPVNHKLALIWCLLRAFLQVCDESSPRCMYIFLRSGFTSLSASALSCSIPL